MRLIVNILFIVMASVLVGCNGFNGDSVPPSFFYVAVEGNEGADLLDENTPDNILNEKIQYVIDGSEYKIAWQPPYKNAQYIYGNFAHIEKLGSASGMKAALHSVLTLGKSATSTLTAPRRLQALRKWL